MPSAHSVFISYKRDHAPSEELARQLEESLSAAGFQPLRDQSMAPGVRWSKELYQWLLDCDAGIAIVSREANSADWCRREWSVLAARNEVAGLPVFPILVDGDVTTGVLDGLQALRNTTDLVSTLRAELERLPLRAPSANDFLAMHQAWLRWQFRESPVLGKEPYALADVYVETECGELPWSAINESRGDTKDAFQEEHGGRSDLVSAVLRHMADQKFRDLIVVQAGPGSGKSAFTLRLANVLMERGFTPILVRFRDLRLATFPDVAELIDDAIRIGHSDEESPHANEPIVASVLSQTHTLDGTSLCRAMFILDGWDEVSLTGNVTYQAQLQAWLPRLREFFTRRGEQVRVVLTGRPSSEVGQSGVLLRTTPILTIRPMRPGQLRSYAAAIHERLDASPNAQWSIDMERMEPIFLDYEQWFDRLQRRDRDPRRASWDVLGNPLLAYLSLRVIAESEQSPRQLLQEPTALYHELIEATVRFAGKGEDTSLERAVHRGGDQLRRLLHEVASTITILRGETVSFTELNARFAEPDLPIPRDLLRQWAQTATTDSALRELIVNFYFKGGNTALGCEFLHKSFREYLFAEAILFSLADAVDGRETDALYEALEYWQDFPERTRAFGLSRRLSYLLAAQWLSPEVLGHLRWLIRRAAGSDPGRWSSVRDLVTEVYAWWAEGVHLRHQWTGSRRARWKPPFVDRLFEQTAAFDAETETAPVRTTSLDAHLGHALLQITAFLYCELPTGRPAAKGRRAGYQSFEQETLRFRPGGGGFMRSLVARLDSAGWRASANLQGLVLDGIDLSGEDLDSAIMLQVSLRGSLLRKSSLTAALLAYADLANADFGGADLERASLVGCLLTGAVLRGAHFIHADLTSANLRGADLRKADLRRADLEGADLGGADLGGADLGEADLESAKLDGARVSRAALQAARNSSTIFGQPSYIEDEVEPA